MFPKVWRQPLVDNQEKRHTQEKTGSMNNNSRHAWFPQNGTLVPLRGEILGIWESIFGILYLVFGIWCILNLGSIVFGCDWLSTERNTGSTRRQRSRQRPTTADLPPCSLNHIMIEIGCHLLEPCFPHWRLGVTHLRNLTCSMFNEHFSSGSKHRRCFTI